VVARTIGHRGGGGLIAAHVGAKWATGGACTWAHAHARYSGAGAGEGASMRCQREGDAELRSLSLTPVQEGEVVRC
jgi:hypothetical protein